MERTDALADECVALWLGRCFDFRHARQPVRAERTDQDVVRKAMDNQFNALATSVSIENREQT